MSNEYVLVIGDAHVDEHQDLSHFAALGRLILERRPTHIVLMGDFLSMNCFSAWDLNKRGNMEGKRRKAELAAGNLALNLLLKPMLDHNKEQSKRGLPTYDPKMVYIEGNHEDREKRYLEHKPELAGTLDYTKTLKLQSRGFEFVPYRSYYYINEVGFTHIPMTKINRGISGAQLMTNALKLHAHSVVFAHTHELKIDGEHRHGAKHFNQALNCGCFFRHVDEYARGSKTDYWRGVLFLDMYSPNRFDVETVSMSKLLTRYGGK